jgi:hypothetical protein
LGDWTKLGLVDDNNLHFITEKQEVDDDDDKLSFIGTIDTSVL